MRALAFVLAALWIAPAHADPTWAQKPVQCATILEINERNAAEGLVPFVAGVTKARIEDSVYELPWILFYDQGEQGYYSLVEYNIDGDYACQILVGAGLDFGVLDEWQEDELIKPRSYN